MTRKGNTQDTLEEIFKIIHLNDRECHVLSLRIQGKTLKEIGRLTPSIKEPGNKKVDGHLDQERIRQIEAKAMRKFTSLLSYNGKPLTNIIRGW